MFPPPEALMVDGGPEFNNQEVRDACEKLGVELRVVPAYSPWVNGLLENMNGILLGRLKRLCAPNLGEDKYDAMKELPANWPLHLAEAIRLINRRILPNLRLSPAELLFGLVINTPHSGPEEVVGAPSEDDITLNTAYVQQQRLDGYSQMVEHAFRRKIEFDARVEARAPGKVVFKAGQLVQIYRNDLDFTVSTTRKLEPKWSVPRRIVSRNRNSYKLETLEGLPIGGLFSARRLRRFIPRTGTALHEAQLGVEKVLEQEEAVADVPIDDVTCPRDGRDSGDGKGDLEGGECPLGTTTDEDQLIDEAGAKDQDRGSIEQPQEPVLDPVTRVPSNTQAASSSAQKLRRSKRLMQKIFSRVLRRR